MKYIFTNRASSLLAAEIGSGATSIQLTPGTGAAFPTPGSGEGFTLFVDGDGAREYMVCTARATDVLTVTRASTAHSFPAGSRVCHVASAEALNNMRQKGDTRSITGDPNGTVPDYDNEIVVDESTGRVWVHITGTTWVASGAMGSISVVLGPTSAQASGGWSIDGGATWLLSGEYAVPLAVGQYTVTFKPVDGYTSPGAQAVQVEAYKTTRLSATYV